MNKDDMDIGKSDNYILHKLMPYTPQANHAVYPELEENETYEQWNSDR